MRTITRFFFVALFFCAGCSQPPPPEAAPLYFDHEVRYSGETLSIISSWYTGSTRNWTQIAEANPGLKPNKLQPAMIVHIPRMLLVKEAVLPKNFVTSFISHARPAAASVKMSPVAAPAENMAAVKAVPPPASDEQVSSEGSVAVDPAPQLPVPEADHSGTVFKDAIPNTSPTAMPSSSVASELKSPEVLAVETATREAKVAIEKEHQSEISSQESTVAAVAVHSAMSAASSSSASSGASRDQLLKELMQNY